MSATVRDIEEFSEFARAKLAAGAELDLVDLAAEWQFEHRSDDDLKNDVRAVRDALTAIDNGETGRPLADFDAEFRQRHGISE
ncbi:MAG: hypothetical protein KDA89_00090 [Planctomycetaceae bacterium]|nr:hypothetical protein [Planctomycetaceae bacterium]